MFERLRKAAKPLGMKLGAISAAHIPELSDEFEALRAAGEFNETNSNIAKGLSKPIENCEFEARTVLVVAVPSPIIQLVFHHGGKTRAVLVPPTYQDYVKRPPEIESILNTALTDTGFHVKTEERLPAKLLAVRSGLAEYGRNNIAYVPDMGSFHYLCTFLTDAPCQDGWKESRRMAICDGCTRCAANCPTGALAADRRIVDVDRCVTWHNERPSSTPFPGWLDAGAHNSLVGCLRCQAVCPANKEQMSQMDGPVEFDEAETTLLLEGTPMDSLPKSLMEKLKQTCVNEYYHVVARNLKALLI